MEVKTLYKYRRADGGLNVSPEMPDGEYVVAYRLIAAEGMALTKDGVEFAPVVDTDSLEGWQEVEAPLEEVEPDDGIEDTE